MENKHLELNSIDLVQKAINVQSPVVRVTAELPYDGNLDVCLGIVLRALDLSNVVDKVVYIHGKGPAEVTKTMARLVNPHKRVYFFGEGEDF